MTIRRETFEIILGSVKGLEENVVVVLWFSGL
jgi:hypothetical protein